MIFGCGPLGYQGSKAAMKLISKADVVIALGTRLGHWNIATTWYGLLAKRCSNYSIDADHKMLGLVKPINVVFVEMQKQ